MEAAATGSFREIGEHFLEVVVRRQDLGFRPRLRLQDDLGRKAGRGRVGAFRAQPPLAAPDFIAALIGALIIPLILTFLISLFSKSLEFGKTFGIISIAIHIIATIGNLKSKK